MTGRNVDLVLGMTMKDFLDANNRAYVEYSKTKGKIEKDPINLNVKGGKDFDMMSSKIASVGNAFQSLGSEVKPIIGLLNQSQMSSKNLSQAFVGLSDMGLRAFQMVSVLRIGVNGLMASLSPMGWLMIGLTAVSTAFGIYSANASDATDATEKFNKSVDDSDALIAWAERGTIAIESLTIEQKTALYNMEQAGLRHDLKAYEEAKKYYDLNTELIKKYTDLANVAAGGKTQKEIDELNKAKTAEMKKISDLMEYQLQTNRISLFEYIQFLRAQESDVAQHYGVLSIEYMKYVDNMKSKENQFYIDQVNNQKKLTADFKKEQNKRKNEQAKTTDDTTSDTKDKNKDLYDFLADKGLATANILEAAFVNQFQNGVSATKAFGRAFDQMVIQMALSLGSRAIIFGFLNMITGGSFGIGRSLLGFMGLGEVAGKASGGRITSSDVARSAFTPSGEDGLIGVQIGETVINRRATQMFAPVLDRLNEMGRKGYASGGRVNDPGLLTSTDKIIDAIGGIEIVVQNNIQANLDAIQFLTKNYPEYTRIVNKRKIN